MTRERGRRGWRHWTVVTCLTVGAVGQAPAWAQTDEGEESRGDGPQAEASAERSSVFAVEHDPERPRSDLLAPTVSFLLPGFDQWWEGQTTSALFYSGAALAGLQYAAAQRAPALTAEEEAEGRRKTTLDQKDVYGRKVTLGSLIYQGAGGLSSYHAFRTAVRTRQPSGEYAFLAHEETSLDILAAPLHFGYLERPSTYVPLLIGLGLNALRLSTEPPEDRERASFTSADAFFTSAFSYNAGTHEEAVFRGWLMPLMNESWGSPFWANIAQSAIFAAAHLGSTSFPLAQALLGYHLGKVTQRDGWRLGEAVFIHVWWDVLAFATEYHYRQVAPSQGRAALAPVFWLPPLQWAF